MNRREMLTGAVICGSIFGIESAQAKNETSRASDMIETLTNVRSAQKFTKVGVSDEDLKKILQIGLNAPSALNRQPWFFSVVTNRELLVEIDKAANVKPGGRLSVSETPTVIFVCADETEYALFDAGTASDRMSVAAITLGYGCKTVATAARAANEKFKARLGVPEKYRIFAALLLGVEEFASVDGVSGATTREAFDDKVVVVK